MNLRLILPAAAALFLAASCTPYVEPPPEAPADPGKRKPTPEEQEKIRQQREEMKEKNEADQTPDKEKEKEGASQGEGGTVKPDSGSSEGGAEKPAAPAPKEIPVARPVPGKPGMVFSPFNNKVIDVKGIPSGRLVADPTYPASEKKHFRVP